MELGIVQTTLKVVAEIVNAFKDNFTSYYTTKSLSEVTKLTRVEPLTILSKDLINLDYVADVNGILLNMFSGYYLQTVSILTRVNSVEIIRVLDRLNPDRDSTGFLLENKHEKSNSVLGLEHYKYKLPTNVNVGLEDSPVSDLKSLNEISNLSVGKMLNVNIETLIDGKSCSTTIPVNVRLISSVIPDSSIVNIIAGKTEDTSFVERWHAWRSGRISFIKDLIMAQDLIDEFRRNAISDSTGTIQEIMRRVNNSKKFGLLTKNPSLVSASTLFVISEEVARSIESKLGGKLSNPRIRERAFENTYAMIITVVDREYERVTFYTRGIAASTSVSVKEIKASNKGKGPDIGDLLKSMTNGIAPTF